MLSLPPDRMPTEAPPSSEKAAQSRLKERPTTIPFGVPAKGAAPGVIEQRAWPRTLVDLSAQVLRGEKQPGQTYVAQNVSAGGALLTGGPALEVGGEVRVIMRLGRRTINLAARVIRNQPDSEGGISSAVRFVNVSSKTQDEIQGYVLASLRRAEGRR